MLDYMVATMPAATSGYADMDKALSPAPAGASSDLVPNQGGQGVTIISDEFFSKYVVDHDLSYTMTDTSPMVVNVTESQRRMTLLRRKA